MIILICSILTVVGFQKTRWQAVQSKFGSSEGLWVSRSLGVSTWYYFVHFCYSRSEVLDNTGSTTLQWTTSSPRAGTRSDFADWTYYSNQHTLVLNKYLIMTTALLSIHGTILQQITLHILTLNTRYTYPADSSWDPRDSYTHAQIKSPSSYGSAIQARRTCVFRVGDHGMYSHHLFGEWEIADTDLDQAFKKQKQKHSWPMKSAVTLGWVTTAASLTFSEGAFGAGFFSWLMHLPSL